MSLLREAIEYFQFRPEIENGNTKRIVKILLILSNRKHYLPVTILFRATKKPRVIRAIRTKNRNADMS